jgi:hypothetical protein
MVYLITMCELNRKKRGAGCGGPEGINEQPDYGASYREDWRVTKTTRGHGNCANSALKFDKLPDCPKRVHT